MTKHGQARHVLPPLAAQGRRRARGLGRHAVGARHRARRSVTRFAQGAKPPLMPDRARLLHRDQCRRHASRPSSARWTWARACSSPSARSWRKSSTCRSRPSRCIMGDTATSVNQGGASGSTGIQFGGKQMRMAAAEARRVLVEMAAAKLGAAGRPAHRHRRRRARARRDADEEGVLCRADRRPLFQRPARLEQADGQHALRPRQGAAEERRATTRSSASRSSARTSRRRCSAQEDFCTDVKVPGMVHGRMIRPPVAGAVPVQGRRKLDQGHPGRQGGLGEGLPRRRRRQGMGRDPGGAEAQGRVVERRSRRSRTRPRSTTTSARRRCASARSSGKEAGNVDEAFKTAARVIEAEYEWPFQSHASMGPACAAGRDQGRQGRPAGPARRSRTSCATASPRTLDLPVEKVRVDLGARARLLWPQRRRRRRDGRRRAGQGDRQAGAGAIHARPGHRLGPEGPGLDPPRPRRARRIRQRHRLRVHQQGLLARRRRHQRQQADRTRSPASSSACALKSGDGFGVPAESYEFANKRMAWETIPPLLDRASPLRTSHLRDPVGPQIHFASESFIDEVAAALGARSGRVPAAPRQGRRATSR